MSYKYFEIKDGRKLSEMTADEQAYIRKEWDRLCARESVNTSERVFIQKPNGRFFEATRGRIAANRYTGCAGGYWSVRYGDCKRWGFKKDPFGGFYPDAKEKYFSGINYPDGTHVEIPSSVHTKKDVLALAKKLGFEM